MSGSEEESETGETDESTTQKRSQPFTALETSVLQELVQQEGGSGVEDDGLWVKYKEERSLEVGSKRVQSKP
jgi:hypothetical protein